MSKIIISVIQKLLHLLLKSYRLNDAQLDLNCLTGFAGDPHMVFERHYSGFLIKLDLAK